MKGLDYFIGLLGQLRYDLRGRRVPSPTINWKYEADAVRAPLTHTIERITIHYNPSISSEGPYRLHVVNQESGWGSFFELFVRNGEGKLFCRYTVVAPQGFSLPTIDRKKDLVAYLSVIGADFRLHHQILYKLVSGSNTFYWSHTDCRLQRDNLPVPAGY